MSSSIDRRMDYDIDATREKDTCSKRDDVPMSEGSVEKRVSSSTPKQNEFQQYDDASRNRKALLEKVLHEYDEQHQEEKSAFQAKISELQSETDWYRSHFTAEISSLKETFDSKLDSMKAFMESFIEHEQEEHNCALQEIEEQLFLRDNEIDNLLDVIEKQSEELKQAKSEREKLKKEMKSILVTLHVQFERFDDKLFKSGAEVTKLREDQNADRNTTHESFEKMKECLVMFQENINDIKIETVTIVENSSKKSEDRFHKQILEHQSIVTEDMRRQQNEFESINSAVKLFRAEKEKTRMYQEGINGQLKAIEERFQNIASSISQNQRILEDLNNFVFNETAEAMESLCLKKDEMLNKLQLVSDQMVKTNTEVEIVSDNLKVLKMEKECDSEKWNDALEMVKSRMCEQSSSISNDIVGLKQDLKSSVELLGSNIADLKVEMTSCQISQKAMHNDIKNKYQRREDNLRTMNKAIETTEKEIVDIRDRLKEYDDHRGDINVLLAKEKAKHEADSCEYQRFIDDWNSKFEKLKKFIQQRSEAQSLASNDFKMKQGVFEESMKSCTLIVDSLESRLTYAEKSLNTSVTSELLDVMLQPYIKQNDAVAGNVKKQAEDLKSVKDQVKAFQHDQTTIVEKIENMSKTWESLFQHLVGQVQKDTLDMETIKKENENVLKDTKRLVASWENQLVAMTDQNNSSKDTESLVSVLRTNMESCNHRISCLTEEIESQRVFQVRLLEQKSSSLTTLKEEMESYVEKSRQAQKNVMSEQMTRVLIETDLKVQNVIAAYAEEFAKTNQDVQDAWRAIEELKNATDACERAIQSELINHN